MRMSSRPLGMAKYEVRLRTLPSAIYPLDPTPSSLDFTNRCTLSSLSLLCGFRYLGGSALNHGGWPSLITVLAYGGQRQKNGVEPPGHSHQVAWAAFRKASTPTTTAQHIKARDTEPGHKGGCLLVVGQNYSVYMAIPQEGVGLGVIGLHRRLRYASPFSSWKYRPGWDFSRTLGFQIWG